MKIAFYCNREKQDVLARQAEFETCATASGLSVVSLDEAEVIVALGGDGTILRAVHAFPARLILGINFGGLGYLSAVSGDEMARAFSLLAAGRFRVSARTLLQVASLRDETAATACALNDIALVRGLTGHACLLDLSIDGHAVTRYMADGLVVATPTGSTAYSLAAGGPVVLPDLAGLVITPMNPHALGVRPLVVRDDVRVTVRVPERTDGNEVCVGVAADGRTVLTLHPGDGVEISKSDKTARLVALDGCHPCDVLSRKLGWKGCLACS